MHACFYQRTVWQDALGKRTSYFYDVRGLEAERILTNNRRVTASYDPRGMATVVEDRWARWTTTYDALGRPKTVNGYMHPDGWPFTYSYDGVGNRTGLEFAWGRYTWGYDALDRNTSLEDPGLPQCSLAGGTTAWQYDARNQVTRIDRPDASRSTFTYDAAGRTTQKPPSLSDRYPR